MALAAALARPRAKAAEAASKRRLDITNTPFSKLEADATWKLILATLRKTSDPDTTTITRLEFTRATASDEQLKRLFGTATRQRFKDVDTDLNQRMSRNELVRWLSYPSLRKSQTSASASDAPLDSMVAFDLIKRGTRRHTDD